MRYRSIVPSRLAPLAALVILPLAGCAAAPPAEDWRREALEQRKTLTENDRIWGYAKDLDDLLEKPDPPAIPGPALRALPPSDDTVAWPPARDGALTVRYRMDKKSCGGHGAS